MNKKEIEINLIDEFIEAVNKSNASYKYEVIEWLKRQRKIISE